MAASYNDLFGQYNELKAFSNLSKSKATRLLKKAKVTLSVWNAELEKVVGKQNTGKIILEVSKCLP